MKRLLIALALISACSDPPVYTDCRAGHELCRNNKVYTCAPNGRYLMTQNCTIITPNIWECTVQDAGVAECLQRPQ